MATNPNPTDEPVEPIEPRLVVEDGRVIFEFDPVKVPGYPPKSADGRRVVNLPMVRVVRGDEPRPVPVPVLITDN